ncbi:MAG: endonuclease domain-containing protein [Cyclobacteriaceae bacterium]|uniref:endonuclease domain-containing protein n=1 Tax=Fulvivirga sp. TaxID=1931237 RepID=UPI0032EE43E4
MEEPQFKVCRECKIEKNIEDFAPNQFGKNNRVLRRPVCRECYAKKVKANPQLKKEFIEKHPRPNIGDKFQCPICHKVILREHNNDVVLDHSHVDGSIRGWLCSSCNTSLGKFNDDPEVLRRAIEWIENNKDK